MTGLRPGPAQDVQLGATSSAEGRCRFLVWAPRAHRVEVALLDRSGAPEARLPMERVDRGYHLLETDGAGPGTRYRYVLDGERSLPDPASRHQPDGVHGPSEVVDPRGFRWHDAGWFGIPLHRYVTYELHVGTFSREGTFAGVVPHLDALVDLGVTAMEIMPVAQFPGSRNWGYDGTFPYAAQDSYGGPEGFRRLVDECHRRGLAVVLDVVHNHLGPEGAYQQDFGPYFTDRYRTPWGMAINYDGPWSDEVRRYFIGSALQWFRDHHVDALRLDAIHGIFDFSAHPFLAELAERTEDLSRELNRRLYLIAESDLNDPRVVSPPEVGGLGLDAQWSDDFHHSVHALLTGSRTGYYRDFGSVRHLARALTDGYVYTGQFAPHRNRRHGASPAHVPTHRFVVCVQNHDQVGNQVAGDRLGTLAGFEGARLAAGCLLLSPYLPLLFMGEEYGEPAPFPYFVSHSDPDLVAAVRAGRKEEFAHFGWETEPPDPQAEETFLSARLHHELRSREDHARLQALYRELLALRRRTPCLARPSRRDMEVVYDEHDRTLWLRRWGEEDEAVAAFNFDDGPVTTRVPFAGGPWRLHLDSSGDRWGGPGTKAVERLGPEDDQMVTLGPRSFALYLARRGTTPGAS